MSHHDNKVYHTPGVDMPVTGALAHPAGYKGPNRPGHFNPDGTRCRPFIIGVTGGTASGKTTVCDKIIDTLNNPSIIMLSMDRFYKSLTDQQVEDAANYNFDEPNAFDWDLMIQTLAKLSSQPAVEVPRYSFETHKREATTDTFNGADVIIVEGILVLHDAKVRDQLDMKIFVEEDSDVRLARRIKRDIAHRGRSVDNIIHQYITTVKPAHDMYIEPTKKFADIIIPRGGSNLVAVNFLVQHIRNQISYNTSQ